MARDTRGNFVSAVPVRWLLGGGAGQLSSELGSSTTFTSRRPGTALVGATHAALPAAVTGTLRVGAGAAALLSVEWTPGDPADAIGTPVLSAGDSLAAHAVLRDSLGNFVSAAPVEWSLAGDASAAVLTAAAPTADSSAIRLRGLHPGIVRLQARWNALTATSGDITITLGRAARVSIETAADGSGESVGARTLAAGGGLPLHAVARDGQGNFVGPATVQWVLAGNIGRLQDAEGSSTRLVAERAGVGRVTALHAALPAVTSGEITVLAGVPALLLIERSPGDPADVLASATLAAGDSLAAFAVLRDSLGNFVGEANAAWELLGETNLATWGSGAPSSAATSVRVRALHPGTLQLRATWNGLAATSGALVLTAGPMTQVAIESAADGSGTAIAPRTLTAGQALPLYAVARDAQENFVSAVTVHWALEGTAGRIEGEYAAATRFVALEPGVARVVANHAELGSARTGALTVLSGAAARLCIERTAGDPADSLGVLQLAAGDSLVAHAVLRDSLGNWAGEAIATWSLVGDANAALLGPGDPAGRARLQALHPGQVRVAAEWNKLMATSGLVTIVPGPLVHYALESAADGTGTPVGSRTLVAGAHLALHAVGRDALDNFVGPVVVTWSLSGTIGHLDGISGPSTTLVVERAGSGRVQAQHASLGSRTSGDLTVLAGTPARLVLERTPGDPADPIGALTLSADDSLAAYAVLRDSLGNVVGAASAQWSLTGDLETAALVSAGALDATEMVWLQVLRPGTVSLEARWNTLSAASGSLSLQSGAPCGAIAVVITPDSLRAGGAEAAAVSLGPVSDRRGNPVANGTRVSVSASLGSFPAASDLDPVAAGLQLATQAGAAATLLHAPAAAGTAAVQAAAGAAWGTGAVHFLPPLEVATQPGSLQPAVVQRGATVTLRAGLVNHDLLPLQVAAGTLRIEDGNGTRFETSLAQPLDLPAGSAAEAAFVPAVVPALLPAGSYAPQLTVRGTDGLGKPFERSLALGASSLRVLAGADLRATNRNPAIVTHGAIVGFSVEVLNAGDADVQLDPVHSSLHDASGEFVSGLDGQSDLLIAAGRPATLRFRLAAWPGSIPTGSVQLVADLQGAQASGGYAQRVDVAAVESLDPARLEPVMQALSPAFAPAGSAPSLRVRMHNAGGSELRLDSPSRLQVEDREAALAAPVVLAADSVADLHFEAVDLTGLTPGRHAVQVVAQGTQHGFPFAQALDLADSLLVFAPAALAIVGVQPSQATVTSGQTEPWDLDVVLLNSGQSAYRVEAADIHVVLAGVDRTASYTLVRTKPLGSPVAPAATDTLYFRVIRTGADTGPATLDANVRAVDLVSGQTLEINTYQGGKGSVRVQRPALPVAGALQLGQRTASAGQTRPVAVLLPLRNDGEAALQLDPTSLGTSLACTPALPVQASIAAGRARLEAGETLTLRYEIGPFPPTPATVLLRALPRLVETNRKLALSVEAADSLQVRTPAALEITSLEAPARVTRGQAAAWMVRATLRNAGASEALLATPRLVIERAGEEAGMGFVVQTPMAFAGAADLKLAGGAAGRLDFAVTGTDTIAGAVQIGVAADGVELDSGRRLAVASATPATVRLEREPRLILADSTLVPRVASRGQRIDISLEVRNDGEAAFVLDPSRSRIRLAGTSALATLSAPVTLATGLPSTLRFQPLLLDVLPGQYPLQIELAGSENGNPCTATLTTSLALQVDAAANLEIVSVRASQAIVTSGQERAWAVRVAVRNGGAPAVLESVAVVFALGPADVTAGFALSAPHAFVSGRRTLATGVTDTLRIEIERTAAVEGLVVLDAHVIARDANSGAPQSATSSGAARGSVRVVSAAAPHLVGLETSQARVTAGQRGTWTVRATVRNAGGTAWQPEWSSARLALGEAADDSILMPTAFDEGPAVLDAAASGTATFRVQRTGSELGALALVAGLSGTQTTDGRAVPASPGACRPRACRAAGGVAPRLARRDALARAVRQHRPGTAARAARPQCGRCEPWPLVRCACG